MHAWVRKEDKLTAQHNFNDYLKCDKTYWGSKNINEMKTAVWHFNIDIYFNFSVLTGIMNRVKIFNGVLGINKKETLIRMDIKKSPKSVLYVSLGFGTRRP